MTTAAEVIDPTLSVAVITYNHSRWIGECFRGIDQQRVSFPIEVCIGDDGSSDGTSDICATYAAQSAVRFAVQHQIRDRKDSERSKYESVFMPNVVQTLSSCRGKYVAIVEGDDFWTDPTKLETQVQFLEEHPEYSMVMHNATLTWDPPREGRQQYVEAAQHPDYEFDRDYCLLDWPNVSFPSCSVVVRRDVVRALVESELAFGPMWDSPLLYIAGTQGLIRYLARPMGCYRIHQGGCWNGPLAGDRYEVIMRLAARLQRYVPNITPEVKKWLQTLFDYNYGFVARRSASSVEFRSRISRIFPEGTDDLHLNAWLAKSSADAILNHVDDARRLRESSSYRVGHLFVELVSTPMRGLTWVKRTVLG